MRAHTRCNTRRLARRRRLAAVAVGVGIAAASGHGVAWADTGHAHSGGAGHATSSSADSGTKKHASPGKPVGASKHPAKKTGVDSTSTTGASERSADSTDSTAPQDNPVKHRVPGKRSAGKTSTAKETATTALPAAHAAAVAVVPAAAAKPSATLKSATVTSPAALKSAAATASSSSSTTTVKTPAPLSPIAQLIALPGRVINTVLQVLDLTVAQSGPKSPFNWAPIDEALFAAFRGLETVLGLSKTPASQQTPPTLTYTGPIDDQTPTVAQFLDAAAGEYTLGGQPGGLKPLTVNGFQMQTFNPLSGAVGKAWVTPEGQIIIAYQGTSGGTNLLFHPLIALTQLAADLQVMFTNTTPLAFYDSLAFERQVEAAATAQGYNTDDIFLTGHSLGSWEAEYVAQRTGLGGIGFEGPGLNTKVAGNGANSGFVNVETYGDSAAYFATDLPGLQPFMPAYVAGGGSKPHYGSIVMIGDPSAVNPLLNISTLWGPNPINDIVFAVDMLGNFLEHHLPGMQAYNLGVAADPGVVPWLGAIMGPVDDWADLTIGQLQQAASDAGVLIAP
jgi:hypothetical protein